MSGSSSKIDNISSSQASKEVTANAIFDAESPASFGGRRASQTAALTWGIYGGTKIIDGVLTDVPNTTVSLTASTTNYVECTRAGVFSTNTTGFTAARLPLYQIITGASTVTSYLDQRDFANLPFMTYDASFAVTAVDVTLTAAQARARYLTSTGVLTGNRAVILPNNGEWLVFCNNTGAFTTTFKTTAGTGIVIAQGLRAHIYGDGTNVVRVTADV